MCEIYIYKGKGSKREQVKYVKYPETQGGEYYKTISTLGLFVFYELETGETIGQPGESAIKN